ncbi:YSC84-related protein [Kangiella sp. TOML190]|uniref:lipid-binding SYLF domain-containing protein n=1 Tax=Kangiella sp. TOML190 TaxID=2931351 RepID=UPI00203A7395|nr:YSC84-related protein [Kangiella sp. TOML190]
MHTKLKLLGLMLLALSITACSTTKGSSTAEKRAFVEEMRQDALKQLYAKHPQARAEIAQSAGYAVFSNINTNLIFVSTGGGYGIATNRKNGQQTYMKMASLGLGLGAGLKDARLVMIFKKDHDFGSFVDNGWDLSGQAGASAQSDEQGGHAAAAKSVDFDVKTYKLTKAGVSAEVTIDGTKFWQDDELN